MTDHPDEDVALALRRLCDALCMWERNTGRQSLFILREFGGFVLRASNGIPIDESHNGDLTDQMLAQGLKNMEDALS